MAEKRDKMLEEFRKKQIEVGDSVVVEEGLLYEYCKDPHRDITVKVKKVLEEFDGQPNTLAKRDRMTEIVNFYNQKDFSENGYQSVVRKIEFNDDGTYHIIAKRI